MHPGRTAVIVALLVATAPALAVTAVRADEDADRRTSAGLRLFRSLLAADRDLAQKTVDGRLLVVFVHGRERARAEGLARAFVEAGAIRGIDVVAEASADPALAAHADRRPAGVFLATRPDDSALRAVVAWGIAHRTIVYSPFEGDVDRGVLGGLALEAQVRPYINRATLEASQITLRDFFIKASKVRP